MYKVTWDHEINGVLLSDKIEKRDEIVPPRPVFHEELDLLGFDQHWQYKPSESPLLWSNGRGYYHHGVLVAEAKGGNLYEAPTLTIHQKDLHLTPVGIEQVVARNREAITICENEAKDFVQATYKKYARKIDYFAVAFSGGKDSQVVLDIVSQMLAPDEYIVIFTDTTMELPFTHEILEATKESFKQKHPELHFYTAAPPEDALLFWEKNGYPSRIHRWCCFVCKTAPFSNFIQRLHAENEKTGQPKVLVFEGVRAEESDRRSQYKRITFSVKGTKQINAECILYWNLTEVFLYLFYRNIPLNQGYRYGLNRVGCLICPFASDWSENILKKIAPEKVEQFIHIIEKQANSEATTISSAREYIYTRQWKKRAGGRGIDTEGTGMTFIEDDLNMKAVLTRPEENFFEWLNVMGNVFCKVEEQKTHGEVKIGQEIYSFEIEDTEQNKKIIQIQNVKRDVTTYNRLKRVLYKTTYCAHCRVCETECPTGALKVLPKVSVDKNMCIHCSRCLDFVEKGCLRAKSLSVSEGGRKVKKGKITASKYQTFGMRKVWLDEFLNNLEDWFDKTTIGNRQLESMVAWLKDSELLDQNKNPTELAKLLKIVLTKNENLVWTILWTNLFYHVEFIRWYVNNVPWNSNKSSGELVDMLVGFDEKNQINTSKKVVSTLFNLFHDDKSGISTPLGSELKIGIIEKKGKERCVQKIGIDNIHPLGIVYSLYKFAEEQRRYDFTVSELYDEICEGGPYKLFGVSKEKLEDALRYLQEEKEQLARVELTADLDNLFLREDIASDDILQIIKAQYDKA